MKKILLLFLIINLNNIAFSSIKQSIVNNLINIENLSFNFEQNINGKILVSNGKSLVIKNKTGSYYRYSIKRTPLNYILDKKFLINEIENLDERIIEDKFVNFTILKDENEINIFFDIDNFNLIGWQTLDIYQNLNITHISSLKKNTILKKNIFKLPPIN